MLPRTSESREPNERGRLFGLGRDPRRESAGLSCPLEVEATRKAMREWSRRVKPDVRRGTRERPAMDCEEI